jgi:hypothetical protein
MYQVVAIMAQPDEIFNLIIGSVLVYMVYRQNTNICRFTERTELRSTTSPHDTLVCISTINPIWMFFLYELRISPDCLA